MTRFLLLLALLVGGIAWTACDSSPKERIGQERMALIMKDIQMAHQYVNSQTWTAGRKDTVGAQLYQEILRRHNVSREDLRETLDYLAENPTAFQQVINRSIDSANVELTRRQQELPKPLNPTPPTPSRDSLKVQQARQAALRAAAAPPAGAR